MKNFVAVSVVASALFLLGCDPGDRTVPVPDYDGGSEPVPDTRPLLVNVTSASVITEGEISVALAVCPVGMTAVGGGCNCNGDPWFPTVGSSVRFSAAVGVEGVYDRWSCMCNKTGAIAYVNCMSVRFERR